ncbi:MAG TPA: MFS transporter [Caulobacteraceae bacterium]|nr:MFS transporter [Caulobacteraceae bacterium]
MLAYCGALLLLFNFAAPYAGLIGIPISFLLKNKLHLDARQLAQFNLWIGIPLYVSFLFGFLRDRWSPFGAGDRGHLVLFGLASAAIYIACAFIEPTYGALLAGLLIVTVSVQLVAGAANAIVTEAGQRHAMTGQASAVYNISACLPAVAAFFGGMLSDWLEGQGTVSAARLLFLVGAGLMVATAALGAAGPRWLFAEARATPLGRTSPLEDVRRLLGARAIYPPLIMLILWSFGPAIGTALQYHLANELHASDAQVGAFYALFFCANIPALMLYGFLCQRFALRRLLLIGTLLAVTQMAPLLFVHSANGALVAAVAMGLIGGMASGAYTDLAMRSCPAGLQGTMMMLVVTTYWISVRFGDLWGTDIYERHGGFGIVIAVTTGIYALIFPLLWLAPRRLTDTSDGEPGGG